MSSKLEYVQNCFLLTDVVIAGLLRNATDGRGVNAVCLVPSGNEKIWILGG